MTTDTGGGSWQEAFAALVRVQARTEEQFAILASAQARTDERLEALAAAQTRTNAQLAILTERVDTLTERVDTLASAQVRTEERLGALTERVDRLTERVDALTVQMAALIGRFDVLTDKVGEVTGWTWELRYRQRARAYLGGIVRRIHVLSDEQINAIVDAAVANGFLSEAEASELERLDLICRGRRKDDLSEVYLAIEVSSGVGLSDVKRMSRRADLLARMGTPVLAVVAGQWITPEAGREAAALGVWQVRNGSVLAPEDPARRSPNGSADEKRDDE